MIEVGIDPVFDESLQLWTLKGHGFVEVLRCERFKKWSQKTSPQVFGEGLELDLSFCDG